MVLSKLTDCHVFFILLESFKTSSRFLIGCRRIGRRGQVELSFSQRLVTLKKRNLNKLRFAIPALML